MSNRGQLIVLSAPSGTGKSSVARRLLKELEGVEFSVSHTSRSPRPGERDGREYFFVDEGRFTKMIGEGKFLEWARVYGHLYGTTKDWVEQRLQEGVDVLLDIDVQGAEQVRQSAPEAISVFLTPPSMDVLAKRLRGRGTENHESLRRRLGKAAGELACWRHYDFIIVNRILEESVNELKSIVLAARCRREIRSPEVEAIVNSFSIHDVGSQNE